MYAPPAPQMMQPQMQMMQPQIMEPAKPKIPIKFIIIGVVVLVVIVAAATMKKKDPTKAGGACDKDDDCVGGNCAVFNARTTAKKCCAGDSKIRFGFRQYCGDLANGAACRSNKMCASGKCKGNMFGLSVGKCK